MMKSRAMCYLALISFLFSFLFVRIYSGREVFMLPAVGDDGAYHAYTVAFIRAHNFDWCGREFTVFTQLQSACGSTSAIINTYTPGASMTLLPFTIFGEGLSKLEVFTPRYLDPLVFWSVVGVFFAFFFGVQALFFISHRLTNRVDFAFWSTLFFISGNILVYYVFRRPLLVHAVEFFLLMATFAAMLRRQFILAGLVLGLLICTRLNDVFLVVYGVICLQLLRTSAKEKVYFIIAFSIPVLIFLSINFFQFGTFLYQPSNYGPAFSLKKMLAFDLNTFRRIGDFFWGRHWGGALLMPILVVEVALLGFYYRALVKNLKQYRWSALVALLASFSNLYMMANLGNHMSYGFRILIPHYVMLHLLFVCGVGKSDFKISKLFLVVGTVTSVVAAFNVVNFESNSSTLTLTPHVALDAGVYNKELREKVLIDAPNYALHSLEATFSGNAFKNLVVSPAAAYLLFLLPRSVSDKFDSIEQALQYYNSPKRGVFDLGDLVTLFEYQLVCFFGVLVYCLLLCRPSIFNPAIIQGIRQKIRESVSR